MTSYNVVRGTMHFGKKCRSALWLNAMHSGKKWWIQEFILPFTYSFKILIMLLLVRYARPTAITSFSLGTPIWNGQCSGFVNIFSRREMVFIGNEKCSISVLFLTTSFPLHDTHIFNIWNTLSLAQSTFNIRMDATVGWLQNSVHFSKFEAKNRSGSGLMNALIIF